MPDNSVRGDEAHDKNAKYLTKLLNEVDSKMAMNLSLDVAKPLQRALEHATAEINFQVTTLLEKKMGTVKEQRKRTNERITALEDAALSDSHS